MVIISRHRTFLLAVATLAVAQGQVASDVPSDVPSFIPSDVPSVQPSIIPSDMPSMVPSDIPSNVPVSWPTMEPTVLVAAALDGAKEPAISAPTARIPSEETSSFESDEIELPKLMCDALSFDLECKITADGPLKDKSCNSVGFGVVPCIDRPTAATMRYHGGDCDQSETRQWIWFSCANTEFGTPPTEQGEESFIVVTDAATRSIVYHQDFVKVGSDYDLVLPSDQEFFATDLYIAVYKTDDPSVKENLIQETQLNFECKTSTPFVELKNRFGSSQLISFTNEKQGKVDVMVPVSFNLEIDITPGMDESYILEALKVNTNFGDAQEFSMAVAEAQLKPDGTPLVISIPAEIDSMVSYQYSVASELVALAGSSMTRCAGLDKSRTRVFGNP